MMDVARKSIKVKGTIVAILIVFLCCFVALVVASTVFVIMILNEMFGAHSLEGMLIFTIITLVLCVGLCSIFLPMALNRVTNPLIELSEASTRVADGDFSVRVSHKGKDELGALADNFNNMVEELSKMEYLRKDFMSSVSHEFKTPIAAIQGFSELLCDKSISEEERQEYSKILSEETARLSQLCTNMLKMSRLDSDTMEINPAFYSLDEQIRRVIVLLQDLWQEKDIEFNLDLESVSYYGDQELMHQVWLNLIENAIKFSEEEGEIKVTCHEDAGEAIVTVTNYGSIIPPVKKDCIFERFYQCDSSHAQQGNGLGLSIVKKILDLSFCCIEVESSPETGTTFTVQLPLDIS